MIRPSRQPAGLYDYALLTGLSAMFGTSFMFNKIALQEFTPLAIVSTRLCLAFLLVLLIMLFLHQSLPRGKVWLPIAACAFFGNALPFCLITWAQQEIDAGITAILMAIMPLATLVLAHYFTDDEKLNAPKLTGVGLGLLGVVVLMGPHRLGWQEGQTIGRVAIIAAALCYAVNAILTRKLVRLPRVPMITSLLLASTLMILPLYLGFELLPQFDQKSAPSFSAGPVLAVLILAVGPTALATFLVLLIVDRQGASFLSQLNFMLPLFGVFFAAIFLSERLPQAAWLALLIILAGIAMARVGSRPV